MADTEFSAYSPTDTILRTDSVLLVRGGVPYRYSGALPAVNESGSMAIGATAPRKRLDVTSAVDKDGISISFTGGVTGLNGGALTFASISNSPVLVDQAQIQSICTDASPTYGADLVFSNASAGILTEHMRLDLRGNLLLGVSSGFSHIIARGSGQGDTVLNVSGLVFGCAAFYSASSSGSSGAATAMGISANSVTGRSINAAGTLNATGADYAEYMTKAEGCGTIGKGDVCGVDVNGRLTLAWADAIAFMIKSTDPNLIGGDTWAAHLGPRPEQGEDETDAAFAARLATFEAALEAARQTVDRIAFCGQAPVNFAGECEPGDYLIAVQDGGGIGIAAVAPVAMTLPQYMRRLGKVIAIRDGRPWIDVQHG